MEKEKICFVTPTYFLDASLNFLMELDKMIDLYVFIIISPLSLESNIFKLEGQYEKVGIYKITDYPNKIPKIIYEYLNPDKTFFINQITSKKLSVKNLKLQYNLFKLVKKKMLISKVHFNGGIFPISLLLFLLSKKTIISIHDPIPHFGEKEHKLWRWLIYKLTSHLILHNRSQLEKFKQLFRLKRKQISILYLGAYDVYNYFLKDYKEIKISNSILFFGRITEYKGVKYLIKAFSLLKKKDQNIKLTIAGKGDLDDLDKTMNNLTIINRYIPNEELVKLIVSHEIIVCPYIEATQSGVVLTSFAFNKPVIATDVGAFSEYIDHNITGKLIPPNNEHELARAISELINNEKKINKFSQNIKHKFKAEGTRSWYQFALKLMKIYENI